jgi:hypothetical protein
MEIALAFWPSLVLLICIIAWVSSVREFKANSTLWYDMGLRHGRELAAIEMWRKTYEIYGTLPADEGDDDDQ